MTYDVNGDIIVYFNGEPAFQAASPAEVDPIDGSVMVGAREPGTENFTGVIDEVFLFNRVIDAGEVGAIMDGEFLAVDHNGKAATTWAAVRARP